MNPLTPSDLLNAQFQGPFLNPHTDITYYNRLLLHVDESIEVQVTVLKDGGYAFFLFQHPSHPDLEFINVYPLGRRIISKDQFQEAMDKLEQVAKGWLLQWCLVVGFLHLLLMQPLCSFFLDEKRTKKIKRKRSLFLPPFAGSKGGAKTTLRASPTYPLSRIAACLPAL